MEKLKFVDSSGQTHTREELEDVLMLDLCKSLKIKKQDARDRARQCIRAWEVTASKRVRGPRRYASAQLAMEAYLEYQGRYKCATAGVDLRDLLGVDTGGRSEPPLADMADLYNVFLAAARSAGKFKWYVWLDRFGNVPMSEEVCQQRHNDRLRRDNEAFVRCGGFLGANLPAKRSAKHIGRTSVSQWLSDVQCAVERELRKRGMYADIVRPNAGEYSDE